MIKYVLIFTGGISAGVFLGQMIVGFQKAEFSSAVGFTAVIAVLCIGFLGVMKATENSR